MKYNLSIVALVYVPYKIITGIVEVKNKNVMIENKFPHVTLMTGDWNPFDSNHLLEKLFGKNGRYKKDY